MSQLTEGYKPSGLLQCAHLTGSTILRAAEKVGGEKTALRKGIGNLCLILQAIKTWQSVFALLLVLK